jgi:endoglucanase
MSTEVTSSKWASYSASISVPDGSHNLTISFSNDYSARKCDRNLRLDTVSVTSTAPPLQQGSGFEAESMSLPSSQGQAFSDSSASGGQGLLIWSNGTASRSITTGGAQGMTVRARGDQCDGSPQMAVAVDGQTVLSVAVSSSSWTDYSANTSIPSGNHTIAISFTNDYLSGCDRNLRLDKVSLASSAPPPAAGNPFAGTRFFIDPDSNARHQADAWRSSRPADAAQMDKIAGQPQADWFGDWSGDIQSAVAGRVSTIRAAGALPVLVAYDIPLRDCGGYSSGGATSPDAYRSWIRSFAAGLGSGPAAVILEPDALAGMDCLSSADQGTRLSLLADAVSVLSSHAGTAVYLDAGHSHWQSAAEMASRLRGAGVDQARGFSLNVSNTFTTSDERTYGDAISAQIGGKHFVIDTSRNGLGSNGEWCNPPGRALGDRPTASTGDPLADAYFWIKPPGESDGTCNGGPPAGEWWADYALGLAQRAAY